MEEFRKMVVDDREVSFDRRRGMSVRELLDAQAEGPRRLVERHAPARFCGPECRETYREERIAGNVHGPVQMNGQTVHYLDMCSQLKLCASCESKLEK